MKRVLKFLWLAAIKPELTYLMIMVIFFGGLFTFIYMSINYPWTDYVVAYFLGFVGSMMFLAMKRSADDAVKEIWESTKEK